MMCEAIKLKLAQSLEYNVSTDCFWKPKIRPSLPDSAYHVHILCLADFHIRRWSAKGCTLRTFPIHFIGNQNQLFFMESQTISRCFIGDRKCLFFTGSSTISRCFCGDHNRYFKPNHDIFLTLTKAFSRFTLLTLRSFPVISLQ